MGAPASETKGATMSDEHRGKCAQYGGENSPAHSVNNMVVGSKGDPRRQAEGEHTHAPPSLPPRAGDGARPCPADPSSLCSSCASSASERARAAVSWACVVARAPYRPWLSCSSSLMRESDWASLSRTWSKSSVGWVGQQICQQQTLSNVRHMHVARWLGKGGRD